MVLSKLQIVKLTEGYIGVSGGYLGDFSYRTHKEFYSLYCDLNDIYIDDTDGKTTRQRFIAILQSRSPADQARILRGVIEKFGDNDSTDARRLALRNEITGWANELEGAPAVTVQQPKSTRDVVRRVLADADSLIRTNGPTSAVDRVHTSLHGHLRALCDAAAILLPADPSLTVLMKALRENHPDLQADGPYADRLTKILYAMSNVLQQLNEIRNNASLAHPNDEFLVDADARLAINAGRTVFAYVDEKAGA